MADEKNTPADPLPPLPKKRRNFICTKCGSQQCKPGTEDQQYPPCARCDYLGIGGDIGYSDDEMHAYARAALATKPAESEALPDDLEFLKGRAAYWNEAFNRTLAEAGVEHVISFAVAILANRDSADRYARAVQPPAPEPLGNELACLVLCDLACGLAPPKGKK